MNFTIRRFKRKVVVLGVRLKLKNIIKSAKFRQKSMKNSSALTCIVHCSVFKYAWNKPKHLSILRCCVKGQLNIFKEFKA